MHQMSYARKYARPDDVDPKEVKVWGGRRGRNYHVLSIYAKQAT